MWARFVVYTLAALNFVYIVYCYFEITCNSKGLRECVVGIKENSSYSEGAIQAFLALVVVMGINFVLNYLIATRIIGKFRRLSFEAIMMVLSFIMTIVLIFSSASRLWLYIEGYGVTNARIFLALFYLFTLAACLIAIWGIYLKKERVINWILAIYFLLIATFFALPSSDLVVFSNYYLAKNGIVKVYDPIAPYYIDQIDEIRNNKVIKTICKDDFYQEVLKKLEKSEYEKYLEDAKYSGYSYGYEPQRLYLNYSKICD